MLGAFAVRLILPPGHCSVRGCRRNHKHDIMMMIMGGIRCLAPALGLTSSPPARIDVKAQHRTCVLIVSSVCCRRVLRCRDFVFTCSCLSSTALLAGPTTITIITRRFLLRHQRPDHHHVRCHVVVAVVVVRARERLRILLCVLPLAPCSACRLAVGPP